MFNENIYSINFKKLALWLIPAPLRTLELLQWILALFAPLVMLHDSLIAYRNNIIYWLGINSQVCYLEKMLNDKYDNTLRRIFIAKPQTFDPVYVFTIPELKPIPVSLRIENKPVILYTNSETLAAGVDFIVVIPMALSANMVEMNALIDKNKLPDKEHYIKRV
jgi:hypothetical protein